MTNSLSDLYTSIEVLQKHGLEIPQSLVDQIEKKEQEMLNTEIVPEVKNAVAPIFQGLRTKAMLIIENEPGKPLDVRVVKKRIVEERPTMTVSQSTTPQKTNSDIICGGKYDSIIKKGSGTRGPNTGLCVILPNGDYIQERYAAETLAECIKFVGAKSVSALGIYLDGENFVSQHKHLVYASSQYPVGDGYMVNTHSNTAKKKEQLDKITQSFNLKWKVKIIE